MIKKTLILSSLLVTLIGVLSGCNSTPPELQAPEITVAPSEVTVQPAAPEESSSLILATTTSTDNSGLLAYLLPDFEAQYGVTIDVIAVGTGQALKLGEDGNADVLMVHARAREDAFMDAGHGVRRDDLMYNDFVIVGPADDPAGIAGMTDATWAFGQIAGAEATFVSRGDDSGTHTKEKGVWSGGGVEPAGDWYVAAGQGMGAVLTMANEQQAYTLSDRATYLARTLEGIDLEILVEGDPMLFNPYGVMVVNPDKGEHIKDDLANIFIDWLISIETQEKIGQFGVDKFGAPLFTPDSTLWRAEHSVAESESNSVPANAALKITGNVANEIGWAEDEVRVMDTMDAESTNKDGETKTYTGVSINALLELAGINDGATAIVYITGNDNTAEVLLPDVQGCTDCIVSFRNQGGFSIVMPGFPENVQVKGVVEIRVK
ncbi:MAG: solute-binding protein [Chloroflexi bacterium]|nr:solute-binding protein [Chloroflexota bacterium]